MIEEIWREIPGYPDYQISSLGQVKSLKFGKEQILKPRKATGGHLQVLLYNASKRKTIGIHKLLGIVFLGFPEDKEVDHINGDPVDNSLENLRSCSRSDNCHNVKKRAKNTSGFPGVGVHKGSGKFQARIKINGKQKYLGLFTTPEQAFIAYKEASLELFDEFSPFVSRDEFKALAERVEALERAV